MALAVVNKTASWSDTDNTSYTTSSIFFTANRLYLIAIASHVVAGSANAHTVTGTSSTWTSAATVEFNSIATPTKRLSVFRHMPSSGFSETLAIGQGGSTMANCHWSVSEWTGVDTSGTNGSGAIVQALTNRADTGTALTVTLAAFGSGTNAAYGTFSHADNQATAPGTGFTELSDTNGAEGITTCLQCEYQLADDDPDATWTTTSANAGIGIEIKESTVAGAVVRRTLMGVGA